MRAYGQPLAPGAAFSLSYCVCPAIFTAPNSGCVMAASWRATVPAMCAHTASPLPLALPLLALLLLLVVV